MIWDTSIWRLGCSNHSKIRSAQKCYPCLRYELSPMSPGRTCKKWSGRMDLNHRPPGPEQAVETLSYWPVWLCSASNMLIWARIRQQSDSNRTQLFGVNPLDGTNYLDTVSAFIEGFLHLLAGEGVWGRGRHLSPFPQKSFRNLPAVLFVLKKHHRCASRFGWT